MKNICKSLKMSIVISFITLITTFFSCYFYVNNPGYWSSLIFTLSSGTFASALVTLLLNISSYYVLKRQTLEKIYDIVFVFISKLNNLRYLHSEFSESDLVQYFNEVSGNKWKERYNELNPEDKIAIDKTYFNLLIKTYRTLNIDFVENLKKEGFNDNSIDEIIKDQVLKQIDKFDDEFEKCVDSYILFSQTSLRDFMLILGDVEFILKKSKYKEIYEEFYLPMKNLLNDIRYEVEHFNLYRSGEGNKSIVLEKIFLLQKQVFLKEYVSVDSKDSLFIWNKFSDDIEVKLEKFRSYIYKIKPEKIDKIPIFVISNLKRPRMKKTQSTKNIDRSSL